MNINKFKNDGEEYGFSIHYFLDAFNETFYKSGYSIFKTFFESNKDVKKWMVFSDYAFYDKNKKNDVVTFTIAPFTTDFGGVSNLIDKLSFKDIKNLKRVNESYLEFIDQSQIFNISIVLSKKRKLCFTDESSMLIQKFQMAIKQLEHWCISTPEAKENYLAFISKLEELIKVLSCKGANLKVIRDIEIISSLAAYLIFEVTKIIDIEKIGWFSDRDTLLSYKAGKFKTPIIYDFVSTLFYVFCQTERVDSKDKLLMGVPEDNGRVWYDSFNRIPDLICATISDYDIKKNKFTHTKFIPVMERLLASSDKNLYFNVGFEKKAFSATRLTIETAN